MGTLPYLWLHNFTYLFSYHRTCMSSLFSVHEMLIPAFVTCRLFIFITGKQPPRSHLCSYVNASPSPALSIIPSSGHCLSRENPYPPQYPSPYSPLPGTATFSDDLAVYLLFIHSILHQKTIIEHLLYAKNCNRIHGLMVTKNRCVSTLLELTVW